MERASPLNSKSAARHIILGAEHIYYEWVAYHESTNILRGAFM